MATYKSFSFYEGLTTKGQENIPTSLIINDQSPEILLIIRLLSGSIKLKHNYSDTTITCNTNYFSSDLKNYGQKWKKKFPELISEDIELTDIGNYIHANRYLNKAFYKQVLYEICHCFYSSKKKSDTTSFIFVYRLLEKIAFAFPLIYASKTQDFIKSFNDLKKLMTDDTEKKELGFFKRFVTELYKNDAIFNTSIDIPFTNLENTEIKEQLFNEIKRVLDPKIIHDNTIELDQLSIKFQDMGSFIITIRNRFFHNMNGGADNIKSEKIVDSDELFHLINNLALQWIATIFLGIFSHSISEFEKIKNS